MPRQKKQYLFRLSGINIEDINSRYNFISLTNIYDDKKIPSGVTKISDLSSEKNTTHVLSFLDESRRKRTCTISMIDHTTKQELGGKRYKCFWDREWIPSGVKPIGCPIKYIPDKAIKSYYSEISQDNYTIKENITNKKRKTLHESKESIKSKKELNLIEKRLENISLQQRGYYETDGAFCSFNCGMAFAESKWYDPFYSQSPELFIKMYNDTYNNEEDIYEIEPAPDIRILKPWGGTQDIVQYRESFNKVYYVNHGHITFPQQHGIGWLFEKQYRF